MKVRIHHRTTAAFTLIEVVLAIAISVGIMFVALYFYSQCSNLRTQLIDEAERIGTMRLFLQKITSDLRSARAHDQFGFTGASNSIEFVKSEVLPLSSWSVISNEVQYPSGLAQVSYQLVGAAEGTNVVSLGIARREQPLNPLFGSGIGAQAQDVMTNYVNRSVQAESNTTNVVGLLTDKIHTLQFRYWNGTGWTNAWDGIVPPSGVEITLGTDAPDPTGTNAEVYRRVVFLPGGAKPAKKTSEINTSIAKM